MLLGLLCAFVLSGVLIVLRSRGVHGAAATAWSGPGARADKFVAAALLVLCVAPFFPLVPWLDGNPPTYFGDAVSHAHVARDIAERGLPHGWVDTYLAGFPFGIHYPPLATLVLAGLLKLGLSPAFGVGLLGFAASIAGSVVLFSCATRAGARPPFAALGAAYLAWVSPYNPFVGGYEAFFQLGLLAQVLALPLCIALGAVVAQASKGWPAPIAALAMATHPQLAVAAVGAVGLAALASGRREAVTSFGRAVLGALAFGLSLYGPGIANHRVPFGWPPELGWRLVGFGTQRFGWWFIDGDLLDRGRDLAPLTSLAGAALLALSLRTARPAARAGLVAAAVTVLLSALGPALARFEPLGPALLSVFQPLRALALVPPIAAGLVVIALEETTPLVQGALAALRPRLSMLAPWSALVVATSVLVFAAPNRADYASKLASELALRASGQCAGAPAGYRREKVAEWARSLRGGRLWFEDDDRDALEICLLVDGIPLESSVPIGISGGGPGAHVGITSLAYHRLEPGRAGADRRAEALGVRHVLTVLGPPTGFSVNRRAGSVTLATRRGATDLVGAGCIVERWRGSDRALREKLIADFKTNAGADRLLEPTRLVALDHAEGSLSRRATAEGACDARNVTVTATSREPGAIEAVVETRAPVDVVFRVTAFRTWEVTVDGKPVERTELVAPGFVAARVPPGRHRVAATVSALPGTSVFIGLGALVVAVGSLVRRTHLERAVAFAGRLRAKPPGAIS